MKGVGTFSDGWKATDTPISINVKQADDRGTSAKTLSPSASASYPPVIVHGGVGIRAILQFVVICSHHSRLIYMVRSETGRMCVYAFFILSGLVSAIAGTDLTVEGRPDKKRPPKLWLRHSLWSWLVDCWHYNLNTIVRRFVPLLVPGVFLAGYYYFVTTTPPPVNPTWDYVTGAWDYPAARWWKVTPASWFVSALFLFILVLPTYLILLRGIFRWRWLRSLFIIPAVAFCIYQNITFLWFNAFYSPYPFVGFMASSYCLGALITDHYPLVRRGMLTKSLWFRIPLEASAIASVVYFATQPPVRLVSGLNQAGFFCLCLFKPWIAKLLDCRWFCCAAGGTIPLLAYLIHDLIGTQVFGYPRLQPADPVWFLFLATWIYSIALEIHLMARVVSFIKLRFPL